MGGQKDIVMTKKAEELKQNELCWQARNEQEANNLVKFLKDHGVEAKTVFLSDLKGFS